MSVSLRMSRRILLAKSVLMIVACQSAPTQTSAPTVPESGTAASPSTAPSSARTGAAGTTGTAGAAASASGSAAGTTGAATSSPSAPSVMVAEVNLDPRSNGKADGTLTITPLAQGQGVKITGQIKGLTPNQKHGFHIHEKGDCSAPDAATAGGHFNPGKEPHGHLGTTSHAGDLGNIQANVNGVAIVEITAPEVTLAPGELSILNRAVVVHAQPDDFKTQPAGNSGARIGCGVITAKK